MKFGTKAVHAGIDPDPSTGAIMTPIYQTTTYVQEFLANTRDMPMPGSQSNPQCPSKEHCALENGKYGICYSSGMGATDAVIKLLNPGDEVITSNDLYGGSYRMFNMYLRSMESNFILLTFSDSANIAPYVNKNTKLIVAGNAIQSTSCDHRHKACVESPKNKNILVAVDNTFASPFLQNPLDLGLISSCIP